MYEELIYKKYNNLIIKNTYKIGKYYYCDCDCSCGKTKYKIYLDNILSNKTTSCGYCKSSCVFIGNKAYNIYDLTGEYGIGIASNYEEFYFDLEDYDKIKEYYWQVDENGYIYTQRYVNGERQDIKLHRLIMGVLFLDYNVIQVDHIYQNTYDNRKILLRIVNRSKNQMNRGLQSNNTSGVSGVSYHKGRCQWRARIKVKNKEYHLGWFNNKDEAIQVRKKAELKYFGEYRYKENPEDLQDVINT